MSTLLERRRAMRDMHVREALVAADRLRRTVDGGFSDVDAALRMLEQSVTQASRYSALVEDLSDVEKYGPNGGR